VDKNERLDALRRVAREALEESLEMDVLIGRLERYSEAFEEYLQSDPGCSSLARDELEELLQSHSKVLERAALAQVDTAAARRALHTRVRGVLKYADDPTRTKGFWRGRKG